MLEQLRMWLCHLFSRNYTPTRFTNWQGPPAPTPPWLIEASKFHIHVGSATTLKPPTLEMNTRLGSRCGGIFGTQHPGIHVDANSTPVQIKRNPHLNDIGGPWIGCVSHRHTNSWGIVKAVWDIPKNKPPQRETLWCPGQQWIKPIIYSI